ncbi:MAG TPA: hypothetical protein VFE45_06865, partial [Coriobacteriia bacterium]|nr:hypothetical protein [Coriobacteriia bacterium]
LDMSNQSAGHPRLAALASEARHRNLSSTADMAAGVLAHGAHEYDEAWTEAKRDADMVESWEAKTNATASVNDVTLLAVIPVKIGDLIEQGERDVADTVSAVRALGRAQQHHLDANPHGDFSPSVTIANTGE